MPAGDGGWGDRHVSPFLLMLIFIATLGPFQFGFHLVCMSLCPRNQPIKVD